MLLPTLSLSLSLSLSPSLWQLLSRINAHASDFIGICTHTQREREREREKERTQRESARKDGVGLQGVCVWKHTYCTDIFHQLKNGVSVLLGPVARASF